MSAIENVDGLDAGMADGMELLPPPETADEKTADEKLHAMQPGISVEQFAEWRRQFDGWLAEYDSRIYALRQSLRLCYMHCTYNI